MCRGGIDKSVYCSRVCNNNFLKGRNNLMFLVWFIYIVEYIS